MKTNGKITFFCFVIFPRKNVIIISILDEYSIWRKRFLQTPYITSSAIYILLKNWNMNHISRSFVYKKSKLRTKGALKD